MDAGAYLERIGYRGSREPGADTLRGLHRAHMLRVPFENLDIPLGHRIELSLPAFYDKIVRRRRGGFCYELNGLFAWLLTELGFEVALLSARVFAGGSPGPEFDHMTLRVALEERWLADVGFGDSFVEPLRLGATQEVAQHGSAYRLTDSNGARVVQRRRPEGAWEPQYAFSLIPRGLEEFREMCDFQQTSPESAFTKKSVCSRATEGGRVTLSNGRLIVTTGDRRDETAIPSVEAYRDALKSHFGVVLGAEEPIARLMGAPGAA